MLLELRVGQWGHFLNVRAASVQDDRSPCCSLKMVTAVIVHAHDYLHMT